MMTKFFALLLGVLEGITEFLPVSSTGHLILASTLLGIAESPFRSSFEIAIQLGAIMAVIVLYGGRIIEKPRMLIPVMYGFIPTAIVGFVLYKVIKTVLLGNAYVVLTAMVVGGVLMLYFDRRFSARAAQAAKFDVDGGEVVDDITALTAKDAILIGLCQSLAVIPGVSRSAATIIGGLWLRYPRKVVVEFSFLLAIPTILAATAYDLLKTGITFSDSEWKMLVLGMIFAFITALLTVQWLVSYVSRRTFAPFAWYRIIVGILGFIILRWYIAAV